MYNGLSVLFAIRVMISDVGFSTVLTCIDTWGDIWMGQWLPWQLTAI